jgi:drug/metabolite transporter (DMT)-like permease
MAKRSAFSLGAVVLVTVVFWGSAFAAIRVGLQSFSPVHLALLRFLSASLALVVFALATRMRLPAVRDLPMVFLLGALGFALYNIALNIGEQSIQSGPAALLIQTVPIWTALFAAVFLSERMRAMGWLGICVGFSGAVVIALGKNGGGAARNAGIGAVLILLAAISASAYNIIQKKMMARSLQDAAPTRSYRPVELTTYAIWAATVLLLPFFWGLPSEISKASASAVFSAVFLGVGPAALAYATWAVVLHRLPAGQAAGFLYAVPVVAFLIGWIALGEVPTLLDVLGGLLALGGVVVVSTVGRRKAGGG